MATIQLADTQINADYRFSMDIGVRLSDDEQFIVEIPEFENSWSSNANPIGTRKVRVESLSYGDRDNQVSLERVSYRGFCKDGSLRVRDEYAWLPSKFGGGNAHSQVWDTLLKAIPTHYHDHAIKKFEQLIVEAEAEVATIKKNGVKF